MLGSSIRRAENRKWKVEGCTRPPAARCRGGTCPSRRRAAEMNRLSLKWQTPPICHCEGALRPWQSREGTGDSHRPPLKWYAPIASVAALSERHGQLQIWRHSRRMCNASKFVIARPRRGRGNLGKAVSFSPMAFLRSGYDLRDCTPRALPRASRSGRHVGLRPPRNDKFGGITRSALLRGNLQLPKALNSRKGDAASVRRQSRQRLRRERRYRRNRCVPF